MTTLHSDTDGHCRKRANRFIEKFLHPLKAAERCGALLKADGRLLASTAIGRNRCVTARDASIYPDAGLRTSYNNRLPATAALRESRLSCMGMRTSRSQRVRCSAVSPRRSSPIISITRAP